MTGMSDARQGTCPLSRYGFAPACFLKNVVNAAQFASAAQNLALRDMEARELNLKGRLRSSTKKKRG